MWFKRNKKEVVAKVTKPKSELSLLFKLQRDITSCEAAMKKLQKQLKAMEVYDKDGNIFYKGDPSPVKAAIELARATHVELVGKLARVRACF